MTAQGMAGRTGDIRTRRRVSGWWIARAVVLAAIVVVAVCHWLDRGGSSSYSNGVAIGAMAVLVATLFLVVNAPRPRWATRWAWFWLVMSPALPVTAPVFLILSGPLHPTGTPTASSGRRLTGGWAFLIAVVVLGSVKLRFA